MGCLPECPGSILCQQDKPTLLDDILWEGSPGSCSSAQWVSGACSDCWWAWLIIWVQTMVGLIMDAVMIGIIFARISHPKYRGRTIAISDSAVISRRDGILKFMFRIADFRRTQVLPYPSNAVFSEAQPPATFTPRLLMPLQYVATAGGSASL